MIMFWSSKIGRYNETCELTLTVHNHNFYKIYKQVV